jgi:hypothetical protein
MNPIQAEYMRYATNLDQRIAGRVNSYAEKAHEYETSSGLYGYKVSEIRERNTHEMTSGIVGGYDKNIDITRRMLLGLEQANT